MPAKSYDDFVHYPASFCGWCFCPQVRETIDPGVRSSFRRRVFYTTSYDRSYSGGISHSLLIFPGREVSKPMALNLTCDTLKEFSSLEPAFCNLGRSGRAIWRSFWMLWWNPKKLGVECGFPRCLPQLLKYIKYIVHWRDSSLQIVHPHPHGLIVSLIQPLADTLRLKAKMHPAG